MANNTVATGAVLTGSANSVSGATNAVFVTGTATPPQTSSVEGAANAPAQTAAPAPEPKQETQAAAPVQTPAAAAQAAEPAKAETAQTEAKPAEDIDAIKGENYALKAGVKPECAADVITLAKSRVKEGTTLEQAVAEVVSAYPAFKNAPPPAMTPSVSISNDSAVDTSAEDAKIDAVMGIKPEKKEG